MAHRLARRAALPLARSSLSTAAPLARLARPMGSSAARHSGASSSAATSIYAAPAPLRLKPPTAEEESADFKRNCDEVQRWFDSPRFKGIKVRGAASHVLCTAC
jgi:isocitrate lyase